MEYTTRLKSLPREDMTQNSDKEDDDGNPKFGRLLIILIIAVIFCAGLTWLMGAVFPNFPNF
ncbi:MAG TPA: hypothetical protein DCW29_01615 [Janthinobacterium sp.]|nr:hypothetical protein [Janthinobacterium sp.]